MEVLFSVILGVGLASACGFKVFVPFLIMSIAAMSGHLELAEGFEWIGTTPALIVLIVAAILEILSYYVPYVDNILDVISIPVTVISGVLVTVSCIQGLSPLFSWTLALILGGTVAGGVKLINTGLRATSTASTGGVANPIVNTIQIVLSVIMSVLTVILPILVIVIFIFLIILSIMLYKRKKNRKGC